MGENICMFDSQAWPCRSALCGRIWINIADVVDFSMRSQHMRLEIVYSRIP